MATRTAALATGAREIDPSLRIGSVHLAVSDLPRSVDFYTRALGLAQIAGDAQSAALGAGGGRASLGLSALADPAPAPPRSSGLFHVAWLHPSRAALADTVKRIIAAGWPIQGASDHGVSEALYLADPDGLGIEIYADRPRERWPRPPSGAGVDMVTQALDVEGLLAEAAPEPGAAIDAGTVIGHVHLQVSDVARARDFYRDVLGFAEQARMPSAAFLAAGGYHHHIGLNSWHSAGAGPAPENAPGLRQITFELSSAGALEQLRGRLAAEGGALAVDHKPGRLSLTDPDANKLAFTAPPGA
jgi:catechol 2,3-dioxygenase